MSDHNSPVRPVLGLPATAEGCLFSDILNINHVDNLGFVHANLIVETLVRSWSTWANCDWAKGKIGDIHETGSGCGWWDQSNPVFDCWQKRTRI
jgi:hypothetical protein